MSDTTGTILDGLPETLKKAAETVRAADDLISAVSGLVPTDSRSIVVEIDNLTKHTLSHVTDNFAHGGFGPTLPQGQIAPMKADVFSVISDGIATGVEGSLTYLSDGVDGLLTGFDDPFLGGNTVNVTVSPALSSELSLVAAISTGNRAHARYVLFPKDLGNLPSIHPQLDIFVLGQDGVVRTAFRGGDGWHWSTVDVGQYNQGNPITAVRSGDALDIFMLGQDGVVRTAFRGGDGWHVTAIPGAGFNQGNPITAVRSGDAMDIFVLGQDGVVRTAFRGGDGWHWSTVAGAGFNQGSSITVVGS
jgi:hypothetical protein